MEQREDGWQSGRSRKGGGKEGGLNGKTMPNHSTTLFLGMHP